MKKKRAGSNKPVQPDESAELFPLGVYPVFDSDLPRDYMLENFSAPDLRDGHMYPWGLR